MADQQSHRRRTAAQTGAAPAAADDPGATRDGEWRTRETDELFRAILSLETPAEAESFFRDLCTLAELEAMSHRWQAAVLVERRLPYHEVSRRTGASTTTVTRVAHWLRHGEGGYRLAIERLRERSSQS